MVDRATRKLNLVGNRLASIRLSACAAPIRECQRDGKNNQDEQ
jgi:hypothetical protein